MSAGNILRKSKFIIPLFLFLFVSYIAYGQKPDKSGLIPSLKTEIVASRDSSSLTQFFEELKDAYFEIGDYQGFIDYLQELSQNEDFKDSAFISYYLALSLYKQLKNWEQTQDWENYFNQVNDYRERILVEAEKASSNNELPLISLKAKYLQWQLYRDLNDENRDSLWEQMNQVARKNLGDSRMLNAIKKIADELKLQGAITQSQRFLRLYVEGIEKTESLENLSLAAEKSYQEGNLSLAELIYERYITRIKKVYSKKEVASILLSIAKKFASNGWQEARDATYAEGIFKELQQHCGREYFDKSTQYLRAYNLERMGDYLAAALEYERLIEDFPASAHIADAYFRLGVFYTYLLNQRDKGMSYWKDLLRIAQNPAHTLGAHYHLGLLYQWQGKLDEAKKEYQKLKMFLKEETTAEDKYAEILDMTAKRLEEIEGESPLEYNLRVFLDACLSDYRGDIQINAQPSRSLIKQDIKFSLKTGVPVQVGCFPPQLEYLWSGELGETKVYPDAQGFNAFYKAAGTKVINLAVVTPGGIVSRAVELVDIYPMRK